MRNHPIYLNITVHYIRPKQSTFARDTFQSIIREVIDSIDLDLETDPTLVRTYIKSLNTSNVTHYDESYITPV